MSRLKKLSLSLDNRAVFIETLGAAAKRVSVTLKSDWVGINRCQEIRAIGQSLNQKCNRHCFSNSSAPGKSTANSFHPLLVTKYDKKITLPTWKESKTILKYMTELIYLSFEKCLVYWIAVGQTVY